MRSQKLEVPETAPATNVEATTNYVPTFATQNFHLASFLIARRHKLAGLRRWHSLSGFNFYFQQSERLHVDIAAFSMNTTIPVQDFVNAIKQLQRAQISMQTN